MLIKDRALTLDINKKVVELHWQSIKLKEEIVRLPDSMLRSALLLSIAKRIKLSGIKDFYLAKSKIEIMIAMVEESKSYQKILKILEEIKKWLFRYLENELEVNE